MDTVGGGRKSEAFSLRTLLQVLREQVPNLWVPGRLTRIELLKSKAGTRQIDRRILKLIGYILTQLQLESFTTNGNN